jgi:undecaprenyl-diphosphatase
MEALNQAIFNGIYGLAHKSFLLDGFMALLAHYFPYLLGAAMVVILFLAPDSRRRMLQICEGALAVILGRGIVTTVIRHFYDHLRPMDFYHFVSLIPESGNSFPSGHMTFLFALATTVYFLNKRWGWYAYGLSFLVGVARIFVGVHWPWDILGGAAIGILSGVIVHILVLPYYRRLSEPKTLAVPPPVQI